MKEIYCQCINLKEFVVKLDQTRVSRSKFVGGWVMYQSQVPQKHFESWHEITRRALHRCRTKIVSSIDYICADGWFTVLSPRCMTGSTNQSFLYTCDAIRVMAGIRRRKLHPSEILNILDVRNLVEVSVITNNWRTASLQPSLGFDHSDQRLNTVLSYVSPGWTVGFFFLRGGRANMSTNTLNSRHLFSCLHVCIVNSFWGPCLLSALTYVWSVNRYESYDLVRRSANSCLLVESWKFSSRHRGGPKGARRRCLPGGQQRGSQRDPVEELGCAVRAGHDYPRVDRAAGWEARNWQCKIEANFGEQVVHGAVH